MLTLMGAAKKKDAEDEDEKEEKGRSKHNLS